MIQDKNRPPRPTARDWAVFRYGLIGQATRPLADEVVAQTLARIAARQHQLPDGSLRRFSAATLRTWLKEYLSGGLDALMPKVRTDKGSFRSIDDDTAELIARHRVEHRALSVKLFHQILHDDGVLSGGVKVCEATLRRFLKARGLDKPVRGPGKARAKYEMPHPNDLWVADFMHGPKVKTAEGKRKAILCAIIDDHSRTILGARFAFTEETTDVLHTFRDAIATYGVPKRFYTDNGPAFSSRHLSEACGRIGCALLHSEPFDSPSRGKIERFYAQLRNMRSSSRRPAVGRRTPSDCSAYSERLKEGEKLVVWLIAELGTRRFLQPCEGSLLHGHVGLDVHVGCRRALVSEPKSDDRDVHSRLQQVHCNGVPPMSLKT